MKHSILLLSAALGLLAIPSFAASPARIAEWNVASGRSDTGGTPIPTDRIERLGKVIASKIKPDVLVLEEVWPASASADIAAAATKAGFAMEAVEMPAQEAECVQLVTILKRPGVEVKDVELIANSNDLIDGEDPEEKTTRKAVLAKVKIDKFDFFLVGVHLKSKRPSKTITETPLEMRDRQCKTIADRLHVLISDGQEKDILLIGDYNMTPDGQTDNNEPSDAKNFDTLNEDHDLRFLSSESPDRTHIGYFKGKLQRSKLDGYAIAHATEPVYVPNSFKVLNNNLLGADQKQFSDKKSKDFLSDHFPTVAEFDTTKDLDGEGK